MSPVKPIILASSSPYRRELMERLGLPFRCVAPGVDESAGEDEAPDKQVLRLALAKAEAVAAAHAQALVIGSDQLAVLDGTVLGKPGNRERAVEQLRRSRGCPVDFLTAVCLLDSETGAVRSDLVPYRVIFRNYDDDEISRYLDADRPYDCAGSFKSERLGITLVSRMEGDDPSALMGLPLLRLSEMLRNAGVMLP